MVDSIDCSDSGIPEFHEFQPIGGVCGGGVTGGGCAVHATDMAPPTMSVRTIRDSRSRTAAWWWAPHRTGTIAAATAATAKPTWAGAGARHTSPLPGHIGSVYG